MDQAIRNQIISIISDVDDMTVATVREDGFPQATTVSYMNDGLTIYFMTSTDAQKTQNIAQNNKVSLTINRPYERWDEIESLSLGGLATMVSDPQEQEKIGKLLIEKFPQAADYEPEDDDFELTVIRIDPKVISLLDYKKGFGHTELVEVS
ncbi:MAG: pyridoxamine 5'-phosphate oxidase family protein [Pseudomonadota bacterium]